MGLFELGTLYLWVPVVVLLTYIIYSLYFSGLSHIPGPVVAKFSNLWKINAAWRGEMPKRNIALHRKYGPLTRIGPNTVSVDDPSALSVIYSFKPIWRKVCTESVDHVSRMLC
jgi:hypothetical protein